MATAIASIIMLMVLIPNQLSIAERPQSNIGSKTTMKTIVVGVGMMVSAVAATLV
jgi:hypothetical protein